MKSPAVHTPLLSLIASAFLAAVGFAAEPLVTLRDCKFIPTDWADGDSFEIQAADGVHHTIRLYGADCVEWHVTDENDARRLREQRRYFGIAEFGGSPQASIEAAKAAGKSAAAETARALARPFTVHTAFADARGDGKHKRIYAFVTTADGQDMTEHLVKMGLARAFGVYRETPAAKSAKDYQENLRDAELIAAKAAAGAWAKRAMSGRFYHDYDCQRDGLAVMSDKPLIWAADGWSRVRWQTWCAFLRVAPPARAAVLCLGFVVSHRLEWPSPIIPI
jgi:endonuclease YncB( thermonuclease family)